MSKISIELHAVIKSMNPSQKRSFTMHCQDSDNSNMLALFNVFRSVEKYDRDKIIEYLLENKKKKVADNLASEISYLYNLVLEVYMTFTEERAIKKKLRKTFDQIVFLEERGFTVKSARMMKKLKEDVAKYEPNYLRLDIYEYESKKRRHSNDSNYLNFIDEIYQKEKEILEAEILERKLSYLHKKLAYINRNISVLGKIRVKSMVDEIETELKSVSKEQCNSFNSKKYYIGSMIKLYHLKIKSNKEGVFRNLKEMQQLYEVDKKAGKISDFNYARFLANYLNYIVIYNMPNELFVEVLTKIKSIKANNPDEERGNFSDAYYLEFLYYLKEGDFENMQKLIPALLEGLEKYGADMELGRKITMWQNLMIHYFLIEDFKSAHFWIEKILKYGRKSRRKDILNKCKLFELLVCYELEDTDSFEKLIRSIKRGFKNAENSNELVDLVVEMMNHHYKEAPLGRKDFKAALQKFHQIDQSKNRNLPYDEVRIWLKSKVERQSMQEITEEMLQKK